MKSEYKMTCDVKSLGLISVKDNTEWEIQKDSPNDSKVVLKLLTQIFATNETEEPMVARNYKGLTNYFAENSISVKIAYNKITNEPVGLCIGVISSLNEQRGYVFVIAVVQKERCKGLGSILLYDCLDWFKRNNIAYVDLDVETDNPKALRVYMQSGFKISSKQRIN